jgi:hypothetical protein
MNPHPTTVFVSATDTEFHLNLSNSLTDETHALPEGHHLRHFM